MGIIRATQQNKSSSSSSALMCFDLLFSTTGSAGKVKGGRPRRDMNILAGDDEPQYGIALKHGKYKEMFHNYHKKGSGANIFGPAMNRRRRR